MSREIPVVQLLIGVAFLLVIGGLVYRNNRLKRRNQELMIEKYQSELMVERTRLQYYQAQIRPHFIQNCIKNIYALTELKRYEQMQQVLLTFSNYLRCILTDTQETIELGEELENIENYVRLQNLISVKPVVCKIRVDEGLEKSQITPVSVLTFVENTIKHAVVEDRTLRMRVEATRESEDSDRMRILVLDNGNGFHEDTMEALNRDDTVMEGHIGITNVKKRLQLMYKERASVRFFNREEGGAGIEMIIPIEFADKLV